jgi:hypothetical protein
MVEFDPQTKEQQEQEEGTTEEEAVQVAQQAADEQPVVDVEAEDLKYPRPRGAFIFVMLLITFYVVYWTISYIEIFIIRGA